MFLFPFSIVSLADGIESVSKWWCDCLLEIRMDVGMFFSGKNLKSMIEGNISYILKVFSCFFLTSSGKRMSSAICLC
jgi:hypothetical protein